MYHTHTQTHTRWVLWPAPPLGILHGPCSTHPGSYMVLVSLKPGLSPSPDHTNPIEQLVPMIFFCLKFSSWRPLQMIVFSHFWSEKKKKKSGKHHERHWHKSRLAFNDCCGADYSSCAFSLTFALHNTFSLMTCLMATCKIQMRLF